MSDTPKTAKDGTDLLCETLYSRPAVPNDYLGGGSNARMLNDAAHRIVTLERDLARVTAENEELRDRLEKMRNTLAVSSEDEERRLRAENEALRKTIANLRRDLANPPPDVQEAVLRKIAAIKEGS